MGDLERIAQHEASHAAMAWLCRLRVEAVSIVPTAHYLGVAAWAVSPAPRNYSPRDAERNPPSWCAVFTPAPFRRHIEARVMSLLAGPISDIVLGDPNDSTGYVLPDPDTVEAQRLARLAVLRSTEAETLVAEPTNNDEQRAHELASAAMGDAAVGAYMQWLGAETRLVVATHRFAALVDALVPHLLAHGKVSGRLARRVFNQVEEEANA